ncbi:MAG TPA: Hpt domain-containing protein [Pseudolabrys sp.]|nr:Hpt domain-containing protein [Pseudolabrys sp.]
MSTGKPEATVVNHGDHEVITPRHDLRKAISRKAPPPGEEDPVARAEKALAGLAGEFDTWMQAECERLDAARKAVGKKGFTQKTRTDLFHAAHDIKGEAATFGYPAVMAVAESLCRLIELSPDVKRIPFKLVEQHVDAVRAIHREYASSDARELAERLTTRLRDVTDEFLLHENRDRPDVIEIIKAPPIMADQSL